MPKLEVIIKLEIVGHNNEKDFSLDYLHFLKDGKEFPISFNDFEATNISQDGKTYILVRTGHGLVDNNFELEDCYDDMYKELGLTREDLTADFIASATALTQVGVSSDIDILAVKELKLINMDTGYELEFAGNIENCIIDLN